MPLVPTFPDRPAADDVARRALWFWTKLEGADPVQVVCVFVTYEALWGLDPSQLRDVPAAHAIFEANRARIEGLASKRFDARGADQGDPHQGQPAITLRGNDFDPA